MINSMDIQGVNIASYLVISLCMQLCVNSINIAQTKMDFLSPSIRAAFVTFFKLASKALILEEKQ